MYCVDFAKINGQVKRKYFKTFKGAKKHYDGFKTKTHYWFNISLGELKKEFEPEDKSMKQEWIEY
jgi:hypothetical protein